ncbi:MAG: toxin TcdB middle/N-terminal domain-containing protein [Planctomycetota bacterium]
MILGSLVPGRLPAQTSDPGPGGPPSTPGAPEVAPGLGFAVVSVPIEVPPGRHGLQPALALKYSSGAGPGNAGYGFSFDPGSIRRSRRFGPPRFDNADTFTLTLAGESFDLVAIDADSTRFRTVIDTGLLVRRVMPGPLGPGSSYWVARGRDGRFYRFGFNVDTATPNVSQVADLEWGLDRVEDTSGNVMAIAYRAAASRLYATRIDYASHPATDLPPSNAVEICWEARGDEAPTLWGERLAYRLAAITTSASGRTARVYTLEYGGPTVLARIGSCPPLYDLPGGSAGGGAEEPGIRPPSAPGGSGVFRRPTDGGSAESLSAGSEGFSAGSTLPPTPSYLIRIRRADGAGAELPPIEYTYRTEATLGWSAPLPGLEPPLSFVHTAPDQDLDSGVRLVDLNRDGLPDLVELVGIGDGLQFTARRSVYLNTGGGFALDPAWTESLLNLVDESDQSRSAYFVLKIGTRNRVDNGVRFLDVNDDGYPDVVRMADYFGRGVRIGVFLNTGSGFTRDVSPLHPMPPEPFVALRSVDGENYSHDLGVRIVDVNRDGRADLVRSRAVGDGVADRRVYLYDRGSYRHDADWILPDEPFVRRLSNGFWVDVGVRLMELNGDGYIDIFKAANIDGTVHNLAYLHTRSPGGPGPTWARSRDDWLLMATGEYFVHVSTRGTLASYDRGLRVADVNGDGRSDIVLARSWDGGPPERRLFSPRPEGGWSYRVLSEFPGLFIVKEAGGIPRDQGVRLADLDGDGGVDYVVSNDRGEREWRRGRAWLGRPLMASHSNGIGGLTQIAYAPAPHGGAIDGGAPAALPFPLAVVSEITASDGMGNAYTTRYAYDGGFYHHAGRDFRGFRTVILTGPGEEQSIETRYFQQPHLRAAPLKGTPEEEIRRRLPDRALFTRTLWEYDTADAVPPLLHPLVRSETAWFGWTSADPSGATPVRRSAVSYAYVHDEEVQPDRPLLRRTERREGDVDDPDDDRIVILEFTSALDEGAAIGPSAGRWFLELPYHRTVTGAAGQAVSESWIYYDGLPLGGVGTRGLPTREVARGGPQGPPGAVGPEDPGNAVSARAYDAYGNVNVEIDPLGRETRIDHGVQDPSFTYPEREIDAMGHVTLRRFDPATGLVTLAVDANGNATRIVYDGFGRRLAEYGPYDSADRPTVAFRHDYRAVPARVFRYVRERSGAGEAAGTDGAIESISFFDGLGRLLETKSESAGDVMVVTGAVTFDAAGRVLTEAEPFFVPSGHDYVPPSEALYARRFEYDAAGRRTAATNAAGETRREIRSGWSTTLIDPSGHRRDVHRNAFGEVGRVVEYEGAPGSWRAASTATYLHDAAGNVTRIVDPSGAATVLAYDALGRRVRLDDPHIGSWRYRYDRKGNLLEEIDPAGRGTLILYDALDRPVEKSLADGTVFRWGYDEGGAGANALRRLTSIHDPTGGQSFSYDRLGRVIEAARTLDGVTYAVRSTYDALSRVTSVSLPAGGTIRYEYDAGGNLSAALPYARSLAYNERGQLTATLLDNGLLVERTFDPATGRPERLLARRATGEVLLHLAYGFLADGQIATLADLTDPPAPRIESFEYDGRHRLTRAGGPDGERAYLYDDAGNLVRKGPIELLYDDRTHPQWVTRTSEGRAFSYDAMGNVVRVRSAGADRQLTYDPLGRLVGIADPLEGLVISNAYDASGQRVREITERAGRVSVLLTPMPQVEVRDGEITLHYFAGDLRLATVDPSRGVVYPVVDHIGSTRLLVDGNGSVLARYEYEAYGDPLGSPSDDPLTSHLFASTITNHDTGLLLMGSRHYDPSLGRFLQPDPVVGDRLDPHALNRYAYARDNPVNLTDPSGRSPLGAFLLVGALALLDRDTREDVVRSVALTAATILLTGALGPGPSAGLSALAASVPALYAAAVTPVILNSRLGDAILSSYTMLFQDLGLSPRHSAAAAHVLATLLLNSHFQRSLARALAPRGGARAGPPIGERGALDEYLGERGLTTGDLRIPSGDAYGTPIAAANGAARGAPELERFSALVDASGEPVGVFGVRELGLSFEHGAVGFFPRSAGDVPAIARRAHYAYAVGGVSTQQFARELFAEGFSGSLFTLTGRASDFLVEFIYGPYGGGLALGFHAGRSAGDPGGGAP